MPEVVLRKLSEEEEDLLAAKLRDKKMSVRNYERYRIIKEASQGRRVSEIANRVSCHFTVVYDWIKRFNESGFSSFKKFVMTNSDDRSHIDRRRRIGRYLTWRNREHAARGCPLAKFRRIKLDMH